MCRFFLPLLLAVLLLAPRINAQETLPDVPSNAGTDFWFSMPANWDLPSMQYYYTRLYISSDVKTSVRVFVKGQLRKTVTTVPYDVIAVDLGPVEAQVFTRTDQQTVPNDKVYPNHAVHVESEEPIIAYAINRTSAASDGLLLYPTSALGREYVVSAYTEVPPDVFQEFPAQMLITAPYDSTDVTITFPSMTASHSGGETITVRMNRGDVYSAMSRGIDGDVTGAHITSTQPVVVAAGNNCAYIPNTVEFCCCDHIAETILPVETWGTRYRAVPLARRKMGEIYRVVASQPDTKVYVDGVLLATLPQVGGGRDMGWVEYASNSPKAVEFTADKPVSVTQYNPSAYYDGNTNTDPFSLGLVAESQYLTETVFATPAKDYPENYINIVADSATCSQIEIAVGASTVWRPLASSQALTNALPFPEHAGEDRAVALTITITPGVYRIRAPRPFAAYLYGFGYFDSYGYPLGSIMTHGGTGDSALPIIVSSIDTCAGVITVSVSDTGRSAGLSAVRVKDGVKAFSFGRDPFVAGVATATAVHGMLLEGTDGGTVDVMAVDMAGNVQTQQIVLQRAPVTLAATQSVLDFASIWTDSLATREVSTTNTGSVEVRIDSFHLRSGRHFTVVNPTGPVTVAPGASIQVDLQFASAEAGTWRDTLVAYLSCGVWRATALEGIAQVRPSASVPVETFAALASATLVPALVNGDEAVLDLQLLRAEEVQVMLVDAKGAVVRELVPPTVVQSARLPLDLAGVAAGNYLVRIAAPSGEAVRRLVVTR